VLIAVVCTRDNFPDLNAEEREWCVQTICGAFDSIAVEGNPMGIGAGSGTREAAQELAGLHARLADATQKRRVEDALTRALLIGEHEISIHASIGMGREFSSDESALIKTFAGALDDYTRKEFLVHEASRRISMYDERDDESPAIEQLKIEMMNRVARRDSDLGQVLANDYIKSPARLIVRELAAMFCQCSADTDAKAFFATLAQQLRASWDASRRGRRLHGEQEGFDFATELFVSDAICFFALGLSEVEAVAFFSAFRDVAQTHPEDVAKLLHQLTLKECDRRRPQVFWAAWAVLSDGLVQWVNKTLRVERSTMHAVANALFLGLGWYEATTRWSSMNGHDRLLVDVFARLQPCDEVIEQFAAHLTTIGRGLLPSAMPVLARKLTETGVFVSPIAVAYLEKALANVIYSGAIDVRQNAQLRAATSTVLGVMIEAGSSRAYRMRDDFLTPLRPGLSNTIAVPS